ncbi:uncharacterized protein [Panulirus ornatus]|uniref:uncharacterized protein n=1 Tax=Panulirus ornatus TaxID=150431 RepID=UPI003A86453C
MAAAACGDSDKIKDTILQLRQKIEETGDVSFFIVPPVPGEKSKKPLDETPHESVTIKKHKKSDARVSENSPELLICQEIITINDKRITIANQNLTVGELAQLVEGAKIDRADQLEQIALNVNDTSTDVKAEVSSREMLVKAKLPSPEGLAKSNVPSTEALATSKAKDGRDATESLPCSTSSLPNNHPSDAKTDSNGFQGSSSVIQGAQTLEGQISEEKKDVTRESSRSDGSKSTPAGENSDCDVPNHVSSSNSGKKVGNIGNRTVSSPAVPTRDALANIKQPLSSASTCNGTSASQEKCTTGRHCQKYSLRTARQQPERYVNIASPQVRHNKVTKTPRKRTIKITLPSLPNSAENSLLVMFRELARFHGCEVTLDGKVTDLAKMPMFATGFGTGQQQRVVPAVLPRDCVRSQEGSTPRSNQQVPTRSSVERGLQLGSSQFTPRYLQLMQAHLQSRGSRLDFGANAGQNGLKEVKNPEISNAKVSSDTSCTPCSDQTTQLRNVLGSTNVA